MSADSHIPRLRTFRVAVRKFGPFEQAIAAQWAAFEAEVHTGLTPEFVALDLHPLEEALFTSGGMANGAWDVCFVATDWIAAMHALGCAVDLAPRLAAEPPQHWPDGWTPSLRHLQTLGSAVLGVPYHDGPECLMFRRDLFDDPAHRAHFQQQFGRALAPPTTWTQLHETARFFNAPDRKLYGTAFAAFPDGHNSVYDFLLQLWSRGGDLFTAAGALRFETPEAEAALAFYRSILQDPIAVHPDSLQLDSVAAGMRFAAGEVALMVNWFGFATYAHTSPESAVRGLIDVAPVPAGEPGSSEASLRSKSISLNVYWLLSIASGSPHQEIAWQFLRRTLTPAMDKLTTKSGAIGCRRSTWADAEVNRAVPFYHRLEELHHSAREVPQRSDWPHIARTIDTLVTRTLATDLPIASLLREAQEAHSA